MYYWNMVLFIQKIQNLAIFKRVLLVKSYISISFQDLGSKCYKSELNNIEYSEMNKDPGLETWITTLLSGFKIPTSITFRHLIDEAYSLKDVCIRWLLAQYVYAIIHYGLRYNIVDFVNQLSFTYKDLVPQLWIIITSLSNTIKATDFIPVFKKKQEIWYDIFTVQLNI